MKPELLGRSIARFRGLNNVSQAELAEEVLLEVGEIADMEAGLRKVTAFELALIADALGTSMDAILGNPIPPDVLDFPVHGPLEASTPHSTEPLRLSDGMGTPLTVRAHPVLAGPLLPVVRCIQANIATDWVLQRLHLAEAPPPRTPAPLRRGAAEAVEQGNIVAAATHKVLNGGVDQLPHDLEALVEHALRVDVLALPFQESNVHGLRVSYDGSSILVLNSNTSPDCRRRALLHQLGHHLFVDGSPGHSLEVIDDAALENQDDILERRVHAFVEALCGPLSSADYSLTGDVLLVPLGPGGMSRSPEVFEPANHVELAQYTGEFKPIERLRAAAERGYESGECGIGLLADVLDVGDTEALRAEYADKYDH